MRRHFPSAQHLRPSRPTGRKPRPRGGDQKAFLDHINEVSKNARTTWFGLLGLLSFVGVTLLGHADADFYAYGAETRLPLVNVNIPVKAFFVFAPALVAALYIFLHLHLMTLWDALADLEQERDATPIADRVFPWLISHAALWYRNRARGDGSTAPRALGWVVVTVSVVFGWLFGILVLVGLWLRSMPAHDEWLTLWTSLCLWAAALIGLTSFVAARARMEGEPREKVAGALNGRRKLGGVLAVILAFFSWETTEGSGAITLTRTGEPAILYSANLITAELTRKPSGWLPWHLWMEDFEDKFRRREGIKPGTGLTDEQEAAFKREATERYTEYTSQLDAPDLREVDLRNARMSSAFLPGANLRKAAMQGANLRNASMQGANLFRAEMQGATLLRAKMQGADVRFTKLQGAHLGETGMQGAMLDGAEMQGGILTDAKMRDADCKDTALRGAILDSADVTCDNLTQAQLDGAVGGSGTVLPHGLTVASCLEILPDDVEAALAHHSEAGDRYRRARAEIRDRLLCDPDGKPRTIGTHAPESD